MNGPVLVAVHDSPAAFAAAETAAEHARRFGVRLHAVTVLGADAAEGGELAARAALAHVAALCGATGVELTSRQRTGNVAAEILAEARAVEAALIVMARVDRPGQALPYIGSHTLRVLEFAVVPVLVVPMV